MDNSTISVPFSPSNLSLFPYHLILNDEAAAKKRRPPGQGSAKKENHG